jgi:hypothetical protein
MIKSACDIVIPVNSIVMRCPRIDITDSTSLETISPDIQAYVDDALKTGFMMNRSKVGAYIEIRAHEYEGDRLDSAREIADEILLRLRLYRVGEIGLSLILAGDIGWRNGKSSPEAPHVHWSAIHHYIVWQRVGHSRPYSIGADDQTPLQRLFESEPTSLFDRPAYRQFSRSYHEPYATDRFLSCALGLENALVNEETEMSNISYKFVDRGSFILQRAQPHESGASHYADILRKIYKARSKLVHSGLSGTKDWSEQPDIELLSHSEHFLRIILRYFIDNPALMNAQEIDNAKRACY